MCLGHLYCYGWNEAIAYFVATQMHVPLIDPFNTKREDKLLPLIPGSMEISRAAIPFFESCMTLLTVVCILHTDWYPPGIHL